MRIQGGLVPLTLMLVGIAAVAIATFGAEDVDGTTITVPDDYPSVQSAIDNATDYDTIFIKNGNYDEPVVVYRPLTIMGESRDGTVIENDNDIVVLIVAGKVSLSNMTVRGTTVTAGIILQASYGTIEDVTVTKNLWGIWVNRGYHNTIRNVLCLNNSWQGLLVEESDHTLVEDVTCRENNVGIESYVWTFEYEGSEESLEGMEAGFTFDVGGSYEVTLTVTDAAGNEDTDLVVLRVFGEQRPWRLGPFEDKEGNPIGGVRVEVRLNGTRHTDDTDDEGYIEMSVLAEDLVSPATVKATKEDWKDLEFEMPLDDLGDPDGDIPPMEREEEEEPGMSLIWPFLLTIAIVIVALFVVFNRMNQVKDESEDVELGDVEPDEDEGGDEGFKETS